VVSALVCLCLAQTDTPSNGEIRLSHGLTLSVFVTRPDMHKVWSKNGEVIPSLAPPANLFYGGEHRTVIGCSVKHLKENGDHPTILFDVPDETNSPTGWWQDRDTFFATTSFDLGEKTAVKTRIGVADGPWKTVGWATFPLKANDTASTKKGGLDFQPSLIEGRSATTRVSASLLCPPQIGNVAVRALARDRKGRVIMQGLGGGYVWRECEPGGHLVCDAPDA